MNTALTIIMVIAAIAVIILVVAIILALIIAWLAKRSARHVQETADSVQQLMVTVQGVSSAVGIAAAAKRFMKRRSSKEK